MKELTLFYLEGCPYCINAKRALEELRGEQTEYAAVPLKWIEESREPALADEYDYYYVPTVYLDGRKLYEAAPGQRYEEIRESLRRALDAALAG